MKPADVLFHSITEVKEFANIVSNMEGKVTLSDKDRKYSAGAKSVMGFSV